MKVSGSPHKGETVFLLGRSVEVQGMARLPHVLCRADPGGARGRVLGWRDRPYRSMSSSISYKIIPVRLKGFFPHALVKVN